MVLKQVVMVLVLVVMPHHLNDGIPGVLHGNRTYLMEDENGQIKATHILSLLA